MVKQKKSVKDKYYQLAKEQGYRARSCFKLIQLNRKYDFLSSARRVIDLCAAPGGWLQVAAQTMKNTSDRQIIGVDLLPIKPVPGCVTFVADITTQHCKNIIKKELNGKKAEVVLCDGAPNVGTDYNYDAYVQNELAVHAFKFANDHLCKGGIFITKVFRSADYNALLWAFQQLFERVEATKPASSRNVSAEIFVVCKGFLAPTKVDPKLFDPSHVFEQVEEDKKKESSAADLLFHKKATQKRQRDGYDESLGQGLFRKYSVSEFIKAEEPTVILASANAIEFTKEDSAIKKFDCTTSDIVELLKDIKLLNKTDLRNLLKWRTTVKKEIKSLSALAEGEKNEKISSENDEENAIVLDEKEEEEKIQKEIEELIQAKEKRQKKLKKKEALKQSKYQMRKDLGIENEFAQDLNEVDDGPFNLKDINPKLTPKLLGEMFDKEEDEYETKSLSEASGEEESEVEEDEDKYMQQIEEEAGEYFESEKKKEQEKQTMNVLLVKDMRRINAQEKKAKQKKRELERIANENFQTLIEKEQDEMIKNGAYDKMLKEDSDEEAIEDYFQSEEEDLLSKEDEKDYIEEDEISEGNTEEKGDAIDGEDDEEEQVDEEKLDRLAELNKKKQKAVDWFAQPLFSSVASQQREEKTLLPSEKTDKHQRHVKRMKREEKKKNREKKKAKKEEKEIQFVDVAHLNRNKVAQEGNSEEGHKTNADIENEELAEKSAEMKSLIAKGMGKIVEDDHRAIEFVKTGGTKKRDPLDEEYNFSDYDSDENATNLALASMLTKKSLRRKLLDQSYNRYAFNDEDNLPSWFVEDENKHYKPQLPVTREMIDKIKRENLDLAKKPIKKVHEARMRKKKRLQDRLEGAKKKAAAIVENEDLGSLSKSKMIQKLYKKAAKKEDKDKVYVVAGKQAKGQKVKNTRNLHSKKLRGKRLKLVDKRMKTDLRGLRNSEKKSRKPRSSRKR